MSVLQRVFVLALVLQVELLVDASWIQNTDVVQRRKETEKDIAKYIGNLEEAEVFYLDADSGSDQYDGKSPWHHGGRRRGPFGTVQGALNKIRRLRTSVSVPAKLYIRSGFYRITKTIRLFELDSNLEILAYPFDNLRPILSGAKRIWGGNFKQAFKTNKGKWVYQHPYASTCSAHLFINNLRMIRARNPNLYVWSGNNLAGEGPYLAINDLLLPTDTCHRLSNNFTQHCPAKNKYGFKFNKGDFPTNSTNIEGVQVVVFNAWTAERRFVRKLTANNEVFFDKPLREPVGEKPRSSGWRYIIENSFEDLDAEGEFYCDPRKKMLYVIPPQDSFMKNYVYIAETSALFHVVGASTISFQGLEFKYTHDDFVNGYNRGPAILEIESSTEVSVVNNVISHVGYNAVVLGETQNTKIQGNHFYDIGNYGVYMANGFFSEKHVAPNCVNVEISNNTMDGCGTYHMLQSSCIHARGRKDIRVTGNYVKRTPYAGIKIGWQKAFELNYTTEDQPIFYIAENHIENVGMGILNDFAGVYLSSNSYECVQSQLFSQCHLHAHVTRNVIHFVQSYVYGAVGVYTDIASSSVKISDNWLYDIAGPAINFHCGLNNSATNNMIVHVSGHRIFGTCNDAMPSKTRSRQQFSVTRNVIYVESPYCRMYRRSDSWDFDVPYFNWNVYFGGQTRSKIFFPKGLSLEKWRQTTGNDLKSEIINPRFVNVTTRNLALQPSSPARLLGIRSVDLSHVINGNSHAWMFYN